MIASATRLILLGALVALIAIPPASAWTDWSHKYDEDQAVASRRDYIMRVLDFDCRVHGDFIASGGDTTLRNLVEDYESALAIPSYDAAIRTLSSKSDKPLLKAVFAFLDCQQESAFEGYTTGFARLLLANPGLVESVYVGMSAAEKQETYHYIESVLEYLESDSPQSRQGKRAVKALRRRFAKLKPKG